MTRNDSKTARRQEEKEDKEQTWWDKRILHHTWRSTKKQGFFRVNVVLDWKNSRLLDNFLRLQVFSWCMHGAVLSWSHSYAEGVETFQLMLVASLLLLLFNRIKCLLFAKIFTCSRKRNANSFRLFCCWSFGCLLCYASWLGFWRLLECFCVWLAEAALVCVVVELFSADRRVSLSVDCRRINCTRFACIIVKKNVFRRWMEERIARTRKALWIT